MAVKKIQFDGHTLIDLTSDTVAADKMLSGYTAHNKDGNIITGNIETATFSNVTTTTTEGTNVPLVTKGGYTGQRYLTGLTVPDNKTLGTLTNLGTISNLSCDGSDATIDTLTLEKNSSGWNKINTLNISMGEGPGSYAACIGTIYNRGGDSTTPGINSIINKNDDYGAYIGTIDNRSGSFISAILNSGSIVNLTNNSSGTIPTLNNYGTIGTSTSVNGITNGGTIKRLQNDGTISQITNNSSKTITTITNSGSISTLTNASTIGTLNNSNTGTISTINNRGTITRLNNASSGTQASTVSVAITNSSTTKGTIMVNAAPSTTTTKTGDKTIVQNGRWVRNTVTPSSSVQGPYYGETYVNAAGGGGISGVTSLTCHYNIGGEESVWIDASTIASSSDNNFVYLWFYDDYSGYTVYEGKGFIASDGKLYLNTVGTSTGYVCERVHNPPTYTGTLTGYWWQVEGVFGLITEAGFTCKRFNASL